MQAQTAGGNNCAFGYAAMYNCNNGSLVVRNTAMGYASMVSNSLQMIIQLMVTMRYDFIQLAGRNTAIGGKLRLCSDNRNR